MTASGTHRGLWLRFVLLVGMAAVLVFAVYFAWTAQAESSENERRALAEARTLSAQMDASWDYIDSIQERINYTHGVFDFKDVYCSVAGKAIAVRFTDRTDYSIRYVRENPRSGTDVPDDFERAALASFERGADEYFAMTDYEGSPAFRYVSVLRAEPGCLSCHGAPAGEKDVTGFIKEGMAAQDVAGAVSIVLPMGTIQAESHADLAAAVVFFCVLMAVVTVILGWGLSRWVAFPIVSENDKLRREAESRIELPFHRHPRAEDAAGGHHRADRTVASPLLLGHGRRGTDYGRHRDEQPSAVGADQQRTGYGEA